MIKGALVGWLAGGMGWVEGDAMVRCITINEMNEFMELAALNNPSASPLPCMYYCPYHSSAPSPPSPYNVRMAG